MLLRRCLVAPAALLSALAASPAAAAAAAAPATCRNLTGSWCCGMTSLTQAGADGSSISTTADYGSGVGTLSGSFLSMQFSNQPAGTLLNATVAEDCGSIAFSTGTVWTRPWTPSVPAPDWASTLTGILELNTLAYTSPSGNGSGDGSGTWASLMPKISHWKGLGVGGIWLAYFNNVTAHFYGIRSVYAAIDPPQLDLGLGTAAEFHAFVAACHDAGVKVFLDVIGHGLVNESPYVRDHPEWFAGGSWGMVDYNYSNSDFLAWWENVWLGYILGADSVANGIDGVRIDIADPSWWKSGAWDRIAGKAAAAGHPIAVWGEGSRYHFSQHDFFAPVANLTAAVLGAQAAGQCLNTYQLSCHDSGWESAPGNYFFVRGSRAQFGSGALTPFIPLWLGGDEYDEDPVTDLPLLKKDLYGTSGLPGGWMYGSVRDWSQLSAPNGRQALMLSDAAAILAAVAAHADVLHRNACATNMASLAADVDVGGGGALAIDPYVRWLPGAAAGKAVLVLANTDRSDAANVTVRVPLSRLGLDGASFFEVSMLFGGGAPQRLPASALAGGLKISIAADGAPGGGLAVVLVVPSA